MSMLPTTLFFAKVAAPYEKGLGTANFAAISFPPVFMSTSLKVAAPYEKGLGTANFAVISFPPIFISTSLKEAATTRKTFFLGNMYTRLLSIIFRIF